MSSQEGCVRNGVAARLWVTGLRDREGFLDGVYTQIESRVHRSNFVIGSISDH